MIVSLLYVLCAVTCSVCAVLLIRAYLATRSRLLLWSGVSFFFFGLSNIVLFVDLVVFPTVDLSVTRSLLTLLGVGFLLRGLVWEGSR